MESYIVVTGYNKCLKENPKLENDVVKRIFNHFDNTDFRHCILQPYIILPFERD